MTAESAAGTAAPACVPLSVRQRLALAATWAIALYPFGLWLLHRSDPDLAVQTAQMCWYVGTRLLFLAFALGSLALLAWPPAPAWLRLRWHDVRLSLTTDRAPLQRALAELQHFASAQRHLEVGRLAVAQREFQLALPHLHAALELDPDLPAAHHQAATILFRQGYFEVAARGFARAEELDPGHAFGDALLHLGRSLHLQGRIDEAVAILRRHEIEHGGGCRSHYWLGLALASSGDPVGARAAWTAAAAPPPRRLTPVENWFRALARVALWRRETR